MAKKALGGLTERERQIVVLVAQGKTTRTIAAELMLSERTVEKHIENIMAKLSSLPEVKEVEAAPTSHAFPHALDKPR